MLSATDKTTNLHRASAKVQSVCNTNVARELARSDSGKADLKSTVDRDLIRSLSGLQEQRVTATNSRPTHKLIEAVARNMRRTIYVSRLMFAFVGELA